MARAAIRNKHLRLDQTKIDLAKAYFGAATEQEAIDRALSWVMQEQRLTRRLRSLGGLLRGDDRPWPYR